MIEASMGLREFWIVQTWNPRKEITYSSITALMKKADKNNKILGYL